MTVTSATHVPDAWPLLLSRVQAAVYLGLSESTLVRICPVAPLDLGANVLRYSRPQLDAWIAGIPPRLPHDKPPSQDEVMRLANEAHAQAATAAAEERRQAALARAERRGQGRQTCQRSATSSA
jgi:hypothetical protein